MIMSRQDGMEIMCTLYRSNRLTALIDSVPTVVRALGNRLEVTLSEFWSSTPGSDMQFRTEGATFCDFVRVRYPNDHILNRIITDAESSLATRYDDSTPSGSSGLLSTAQIAVTAQHAIVGAMLSLHPVDGTLLHSLRTPAASS